MSGHSQFKNIMYRKGAQDAKKARVFAKLARDITIAAKSGLPEPDKNPRLRLAQELPLASQTALLGKYSYNIYLWHYPVIVLLLTAFH